MQDDTPTPGLATPPPPAKSSPSGPAAASTPAAPAPSTPAAAVVRPAPSSAVETDPAVPSLVPFLTTPAPQAVQEAPVVRSFSAPSLAPSVVRIGLLLPLTGNRASIGADRLRAAQDMLNAVQLALFDFANEHFEVVIHDTEGTAAGAADAVNLAIADGASLILGPLLAASVRAVTPAARAAGANVVAFSSDRSVAGDGVYTMGFFPEDEVERVVAHALGRGLRRFAALAPDTAYGRAVATALRSAVEAGGGLIGRVQFYDPEARDFAATVKQLARYDARRGALVAQRRDLEGRTDEIAKRALQRLERLQTIGELPFDALFLGDGGKRLQAIAAFLPFYDVDPAKIRMLGTRQWDVAGIGAEPALSGGWYAAPTPARRADFEARYTATYGARPHRLATIAYDAAALAATLARGEGGADFSAAALTQPSGFAGHDGIFRFLPDGTAERGLAVLEVGPRAATVVSPAPETFAQPIN
jgi:ABC-type branched-subunit amino acid transport system substrate-binding protein